MKIVLTLLTTAVFSGMVFVSDAQTKKATPAKATTTKKPTKKPAAKPMPTATKKPGNVKEVAQTAPPPPPPPPPPPMVGNDEKPKKPISFEGGITFAMPVRTFHLFQSFGIGVDGAAHYNLDDIVKNLSVGARVNYAYFFAKSSSTITFVKSHATSIVDVLADVQYKLPYNIIVGGGLGLGLSFSSLGTNTGFAKAAYAGYELELPKNSLMLSLFYGQAMPGTKNVGIRAALRL